VIAQRAEDIEEEFDHLVSRAVSYEDIAISLKKLAPVADLLTGADAPSAVGLNWDEPVVLPWGKARFLRIGHRS
jgi:hypothetical protein